MFNMPCIVSALGTIAHAKKLIISVVGGCKSDNEVIFIPLPIKKRVVFGIPEVHSTGEAFVT